MAEFFERKTLDIPDSTVGLREPRDYARVTILAELLNSNTADASMVEDLEGCLNDPNPLTRELATVALGQIGAPAVTGLAQALDEKQPVSVRIAAASGLSRAGADAAPAVERLCKCLESPDHLLRWHAGFALGKIGRPGIPSLKNLLSSSNTLTQWAAVNALGWIGAGARDAVETIKSLTSSSSHTLRLACSSALLRITGDSSGHLPPMLEAVHDADAGVRKDGLQAVGELGPAANQASSKVLGCLSDPSAAVRAEAALALARIDASGAETVQALTRLLQDTEPEVRANAGIALARFGRDAQSALPALQTMQTDKDARLVAIAKAAVESISHGRK